MGERYLLPVTDLTVIAVDWSGGKGPGRHKGIWLASKNLDGEQSRGRWKRQEIVDHIIAMPEPLIVGFDFSFGLPSWFAEEQGCETIDEVWRRVADHGERWLGPPAR